MTPEAHKNNEVPAVKQATAAKPAPTAAPAEKPAATAKPTPTTAPVEKPAAAANPAATAQPSSAAKPAPGAKSAPTAKKSGAAAKPTLAKKSAAGSKRTWKSKVLVGGLAAVVLLGGGIFVGTILPDPSKSDAYVALVDSKAGADEKLQSLQGDYSKLEGIYLNLKSEIDAREAAVGTREKAAEEAEKKNAETAAAAQKKNADAEAAVKKREEAVTGAEAQKAKNTFGDGTRTVGRDIEPGTYITAGDVGSSCYWAILTSGTNGSDIVDNDIPGGGRPSVTISEGQDFKSSRCGSWTKQ